MRHRISSASKPSLSELLSPIVINQAKDIMNKDQVKGRVEQAKGAVKETTGKVVGNPELEAKGTVDKASGKVQATYGDAKEKVKGAIDKA